MRRFVRSALVLFALALLITPAIWAGGGAEAGGSATAGVGTGKFKEAPVLAKKVQAKEIPPIQERIPANPMVRKVVNEVGQYGGILYTFARDPDPWQDAGDMTEVAPRYFVSEPDGGVTPGMMLGYQQSSDYKSITLNIRPGMRWSDGTPITMDDFLFNFNDLYNTPDITMWNMTGAPVAGATKLDEWTFRLDFKDPHPSAPENLAGPGGGSWTGLAPANYLKKWHIKYNPDAEKLAVSEGFKAWTEAFHAHQWWAPTQDLKRPTIHPWVLTVSDSAKKVMERNPYYFVVDTAGNQLPYIDQIVSTIVNAETYDLKIISGEADLAYLFTAFSNYTLYKQNEKAGGYTTHLVPGLFGAEVVLEPNWNVADPVKNKLFNDRRFRIALSVAINRKEINDVIFSGKGVPRQATIASSFVPFKKEWADAYANFDPAQANKLLDEAGLTRKDKDGFRLDPSGQPLVFTINHQTQEIGSGFIKILELVKEYWGAVGVKAQLKAFEPSFYSQIKVTDQAEINTRPFEKVIAHVSASTESEWAPLWGAWIRATRQIANGERKLSDFQDGKLPGLEPPQWIKDHDALLYQAQQLPSDSAQYKQTVEKLMGNQAANLFLIGTVGEVPFPIIAKNYVKNVPLKMAARAVWNGELSEPLDQLYIKK